jgi:hypothetical protein
LTLTGEMRGCELALPARLFVLPMAHLWMTS